MADDFPGAGSFAIGANQSPPASNATLADRFERWLRVTKRLFGGSAPKTVTIAGGSITPDGTAFHLMVDTEGGSAADDLDVINPTNFHAGAVICVRSVDASRQVTIRHGQGSNAFLSTKNQTNVTLKTTSTRVFFQLSSDRTQWQELFRIWGNDQSGARADLGLSSAAIFPIANADEAYNFNANDRLMTPLRMQDALINPWIVDRLAEEEGLIPDDTWLMCSRPDGLYKIALSTVLSASFTHWTVTGEMAVTVGTTANFAHNLGGRPGLVIGKLRCITGEFGWTAGTETDFLSGITYGANANNFVYKCGSVPQVIRFDTGAAATVNANNWRFVMYGYN